LDNKLKAFSRAPKRARALPKMTNKNFSRKLYRRLSPRFSQHISQQGDARLKRAETGDRFKRDRRFRSRRDNLMAP
jgi:hypothetical protein